LCFISLILQLTLAKLDHILCQAEEATEVDTIIEDVEMVVEVVAVATMVAVAEEEETSTRMQIINSKHHHPNIPNTLQITT